MILGAHWYVWLEALAAIIIVAGLVAATWRLKRRPRVLKHDYFRQRWQETQKLCGKEETWPLAVINADKLVEEALRRRKYRGKTMGEKLVSAQHDIKSNDTVWFGHKLRNKLVHEDLKKLKQRDVKDALLGFRSALKDLGALKDAAVADTKEEPSA